MLCTGIVAVPVSWAVLRQAEAERGEATPDAAANVYVLQMSSGEELGLSRVLVAARHDQLLGQWRKYRVFKAALNGPHAPPPGRAPAAAAGVLRPSRLMPGGWRGERGSPEGRRRTTDR